MILYLRLNSVIFFISIVCTMGTQSCSKKVIYSAPKSFSQEEVLETSAEKQIAYQFVSVSKKDDTLLNTLLSANFTSNDQNWNGKKETFINKRNSDSSYYQMKPIRIIQDGSLVALHSRMLGDTLRFRWDILRIENEKIQEHWSNSFDSIGLNPDKHSEIDGPTLPSQLDKTDTNRELIERFIDQCMIREDGGASKFFDFGLYIQHNRDVGDGLNGLLWGMYKMKRQGHVIKFKYNYHVIAEGNFVLSATEGYIGKEKYTFFDLFRIEENKIIEHWDVIAPMNEFLYFEPMEK